MILKAMESDRAKNIIKKLRAFCKSGQDVLSIDLEFKCYACFPEDIPTQPPVFALLTQNKENMKQAYS